MKSLVIAEKPSVGRDLASALPGSFPKSEGYLESDDYVITWAVGHLVQLADPEEYDEKFKKWRMADLPIVPEEFQLVPRDAKSKKQLNLILKQLKRDDVDLVAALPDGRRDHLPDHRQRLLPRGAGGHVLDEQRHPDERFNHD